MTPTRFLIALILVIAPFAHAQNTTPGEPPVARPEPAVAPGQVTIMTPAVRLSNWQLFIRKSFASRIEEQKPATFTYQTAGDARNRKQVDVAVGRYFDSNALHFAPAIEWHRDTAEKTEKNKVLGGVSFDYQPALRPFAPLFRGRTAAVRDVLKSNTTGDASLLMTLVHVGGPWPGNPVRYGNAFHGTYYPYFGVEYLNNQTFDGVNGADVTLAVARFEASWYPLNKPANDNKINSPLEIAVTYTYRHPFDDITARDEYHLLSLDVNLFIDAGHHAAVGFTYQNGADPDADFAVGHSGVLALKLKI